MVWKIHIEANKDVRDCKRASKGVLRASEKVWRVSASPVHRGGCKLIDSCNTKRANDVTKNLICIL